MIGRKLLNRYQIQEHLGDGSTATVYKAVDTRLGRQVALKILLPHVRESTRNRFFQEALAAAQLNHPNIMSIYDIGDDEDFHFLVVEYVDGLSLASYIPSPPMTVINFGRQIASALQYAHDRQVIHRDIKPANIKVTPGGVVKIMDLGLALPRDAQRVTAEGMVIGTPAYLSPEQAQGYALDHRTDIYSLGIVLYEMATGHLPFDSDEIPALLLQQVRQPAPPPRLMAPDLPVDLERIILRTLEKNPARRFQSCEALGNALQAVLTGSPSATAETPKPAAPSADGQTDAKRATQPTGTVRRARPTVRVMLADDHTILRRSLASFLQQQDDFLVVAEASNGDEALQQVKATLPDVLLLDLNMPGRGGLDVLPNIRAEAPNVRVLILTGREEDWYIMRALRTGAHGYLLKTTDENDLVDGIRKVLQGQTVLGQGVAEKLVGTMSMDSMGGPLSATEKQVLLYVAAGLENVEIARQMQVTQQVVIESLASVMNKLGAGDRHSAALAALRQGLIDLNAVQDL
jgi:DNA-binding NarL/FixJ family response regulator/tRNA A-37 threonylcarbamoyl transferase component Bud32